MPETEHEAENVEGEKQETQRQEAQEEKKICISQEVWDNIPPEVKSLHANLYKPFWVKTRYGTTEVGVLVGARWELDQIQMLVEETVYDPKFRGYVTRYIIKSIDGKMVVAYGAITREIYEQPEDTA